VTFDTFSLERAYAVPVSRVYQVFADPEAKSGLMDESGDGSGGQGGYDTFEFWIGGRESFSFKESDGRTMTYDAMYYDIVDQERIVYAYEMCADGERISVSVATLEFVATSGGTKLTWTEQGAYLDGLDQPKLRKGGTSWMLDNLKTHFAAP
jgi:uncharacterized protein YndB with AHSA1/START domain